MSLEIVKVDAIEEFVLLRVLEDCNLQGFGIVDETFNADRKETNTFRHTYLFPPQDVIKDEYVFLFTENGTYEYNKENKSHIFFWCSKENVWNNIHDKAMLITYDIISEYEEELSLSRYINERVKRFLENLKNKQRKN